MTTVKLGDIEKEIWLASSWQVEEDEVNRIMRRVNEYLAQGGGGGGVDPGYHAAAVAEARTLGSNEGYSSARAALTVEDLPQAERERLEELRAAARSEGYTLGHNEGLAKGHALAKPMVTVPVIASPLPKAPATGTLVQVDGEVWQYLGAPEVLSVSLVQDKPPLPVRPVKARAVTRQVSVQGTSQLRPDQRKCRVCQEIKDLEADFYRDAKGQQGRKTICKSCEVTAKAERKAREAQVVTV